MDALPHALLSTRGWLLSWTSKVPKVMDHMPWTSKVPKVMDHMPIILG